jgi:hypothetical protein
MLSKWLSEPAAVQQAKDVLAQAGIPLELEVSDVCHAFCADHTSDNIQYSSEKLIYSRTENEYREIDQRVLIYEELTVGRSTGIQLMLNLPIECKYRKDVKIFAFPLDEEAFYQGFPVYGAFAGSRYFSSLFDSYQVFSGMNNNSVALVRFKDDQQTALGICEENLIYNAAGALYDFILYDLVPGTETTTSEWERYYPVLDELGVFDRFKRYLERTHYSWMFTFRDWVSSIHKRDFTQFNRRYFGKKGFFQGLVAHLPVVCVIGQIYEVTWNQSDGIQGFTEIPLCLTSIRKTGWPGLASSGLLTRAAEVPVIVTNAANLKKVLDLAVRWYTEIRKLLTSSTNTVVDHWALEACLYQRAAQHYANERISGYRSDLSFLDQPR